MAFGFARDEPVSCILAGFVLAIVVMIIVITTIIAPVAFASPAKPPLQSSSLLSMQQPVVPIVKNLGRLDAPSLALSEPAQSGGFLPVSVGQSFDAQGEIDSITDITESLSYGLQGSWIMHVRGGNVVQFEVNMDATPSDAALGKAHTHQLLNYAADHVGLLDSDDNFFTSGKIDVGTNDKLSWQHVPVVITFRDGDTITITLDDTQAGHHFAGQPLSGTIESITPCEEDPQATMSDDEDPCQEDAGSQGGDSGIQNDDEE